MVVQSIFTSKVGNSILMTRIFTAVGVESSRFIAQILPVCGEVHKFSRFNDLPRIIAAPHLFRADKLIFFSLCLFIYFILTKQRQK